MGRPAENESELTSAKSTPIETKLTSAATPIVTESEPIALRLAQVATELTPATTTSEPIEKKLTLEFRADGEELTHKSEPVAKEPSLAEMEANSTPKSELIAAILIKVVPQSGTTRS